MSAEGSESDHRAGRMRQARRAQILAVAKHLFAERGYHDASINDIISRAKIARGTFYLYFSSKQKVFSSILDEAVMELGRRIRPIDVGAGATPPEEQLRASLVRVFEFVLGDRDFTRLLLHSNVGREEEVTTRLDGFYARVFDLVRSSLEQGIRMGLVRKCDTSMIAAALLGAVQGIIGQLISPPVGETSLAASTGRQLQDNVEPIVDELIAFVLQGVVIPSRWQQ